MKRLAIPSLIATTLLSACAGNSLTPQSSNHFSVNSQPSGASVYVMGVELGTTPLEVTSNQVFPPTYPEELQSKYGKVELKYPGCQPFEKAVSGSVLANGLTAKLDCGEGSPAPDVATKATTPRGDVQDRLRKLRAIFDEGLITEDEYRAKRQAILQDL